MHSYQKGWGEEIRRWRTSPVISVSAKEEL